MKNWPENLDWSNFKNEYISLIADHIWPRYHQDTNEWSGDATNFCVELTERELLVMIDEFQCARAESGEHVPMLRQFPKYPHSESRDFYFDHKFHFQAEDGVNFLERNQHKPAPTQNKIEASRLQGSNFISYLPGLDIDKFHNEFYKDRINKLEGLFDFKNIFQRPRPLQTAMIFSIQNFETHIGLRGKHTGMTPSLISGHCLQGILQSCKVLEIWINEKTVTNEKVEALKQYAVDYGDRRVYAGVHYPSDNISSWILALKLIPHIFRHQEEILEFAKHSIRHKSHVYSVISSRYQGLPALEILNCELSKEL